jgi:hypothetical protein
MEPVASSFIVFVFVFGGALLGMFLRARLPQHHLGSESKSVVTIGIGLVATMSALVLGLLISSAKGYFDTQLTELTQMSANVVLLDRVLAHYGPEASGIRTDLRQAVNRYLDVMWPKNGAPASKGAELTGSEGLYDEIQSLVPKDDAQRETKAQALSTVFNIAGTRWLLVAQRATSISIPLLVTLIFWLTIIFISFGVFAPRNAMTLTSLCISALAVSSAVLLILELYSPYQGFIQVPSAPLQAALARLGQ